MVTAADGARKYYKWGDTVDDSGNRVQRSTTPDEAVLLDKRMRQVWAGHSRHVVIHNTGTFQDKVSACTTAVLAIADEVHPAEVARARASADGAAANQQQQ